MANAVVGDHNSWVGCITGPWSVVIVIGPT